MKIIFFGTSQFAADILAHLIKNHRNIVAVVTRPDRPKGRSLRLEPTPVKRLANEISPTIPLLQPSKVSTPEFAQTLSELHPDLFIVAAFGEIIKQNILNIPPLGCINVHPSLLPKFRGAAPIQRALMEGVQETGVTIIEVAAQMDAGDIFNMKRLFVPENMTFGELEKELCELSCTALLEVIDAIEKGIAKKTPQDHSLATFASKLTATEERIDWSLPAKEIHNLVRALSPFPGAWCEIRIGEESKRLKIKRSLVIKNLSDQPKTILAFGKEGWIIACGEQALQLLEVQLEGKKTMKVEDFIKGIHQPVTIL